MSGLNDKNRVCDAQSINLQLDCSRDLLAEELLTNINTTPIGKLLKKIAELPEIRQEKVTQVRGKIIRGEYDMNHRLEAALDKVLEELIR